LASKLNVLTYFGLIQVNLSSLIGVVIIAIVNFCLV